MIASSRPKTGRYLDGRSAGGGGRCRRNIAGDLLCPHRPSRPSRFEAGAFDEDVEAAGLLQEYEAKIAALERMVGRQALEIEFLKGALKNAPRPRSAPTSVISGPKVFPSAKDAV
jgi:hypothetical protein